LTNILRDINEDAVAGRLYLPREFLETAGIHSRDPNEVIAHPTVDDAARQVALVAHVHFRKARELIRSQPRGYLRAPLLMIEVYSRLLTRMEAVGWSAPRQRARISPWELLWVILRAALVTH